MAKRFSGQVKAEDIREEFNRFVTSINEVVNKYNSLIATQDYDYTKGSPSLGAYGYTLTVGGLKTLLSKANNYVMGCKIFKSSDTVGLVTPGIYIDNNGGHLIRSQEITIGPNNFIVWFNKETGNLLTNSGQNPGDNWTPIRELNPRRDVTALLNTRRNLQFENTSGLSFSTPNVDYPLEGGGTPFTSADYPVFISGNEDVADVWQDWRRTYLFGTMVQENNQRGNRIRCYWSGMNYLFIPKNCNNPYTYNYANKQVVMGVNRGT